MNNQEIIKQFSKHFKRLEEDLSQINGFTPLMKKVISLNLKNLEKDILEITQNEVRDDGYYNK
ncbi:hypothetical protein EOM39_01215 [Candidatus Gracilibacteria bacterium]|nr:hypothetical protein [Candidatus Gracilibacteria bacterium]